MISAGIMLPTLTVASLSGWAAPAVHAAAVWTSRASWQATVLVVLVLLVRGALGARLSARARSALWWVVLARLLLPPIPMHRATIWPSHEQPGAVTAVLPSLATSGSLPAGGSTPPQVPPPRTIDSVGISVPLVAPLGHNSVAATAVESLATAPAPSSTAASVHPKNVRIDWRGRMGAWIGWLPLAWAAGALAFLIGVIASSLALELRLRRLPHMRDREVLAAIAGCAADVRLRRLPRVLVTPGEGGPAVAGLWRPAVLIPATLPERVPQADLRLLLLHELSHLKRRDLWLAWLLGLVAAVHWANPALVWAVRRMRRDMELACDESAIRAAASSPAAILAPPQAYGSMLLRMAEAIGAACPRGVGPERILPAAVPAPAGVLPAFHTARELDRRIAMALRFSPSRSTWPAAVVGGLLVLSGAVLLVDAAEPTAPPEASTPPNATSPAPGDPNSTPAPTGAPADAPAVGSFPGGGGPPRGGPTSHAGDRFFSPPATPLVDPSNGWADVLRARIEANQAAFRAAEQFVQAAESPAEAGRVSTHELLQDRADLARLKAEQMELEWQLRRATDGPAAAAPAPGVMPVPLAPPPAPGVAAPPAMPGRQASAAPTGGAATPVVETEADRQADAEVEGKLEKRMPEVSFEQVPLSDVVDFLRDASGVTFFVDTASLKQSGIAANPPVSVRARQLPLSTVIERALRSIDPGGDHLGYVVDRGQVFVSTDERLNQMLATRSYDIADLLPGGQDVAQVVQRFVAPDSWADNGGSIGRVQQVGSHLIVTQTKPNLRQVDRFLALLRSPTSNSTSEVRPPAPAPAPAVTPAGVPEPTRPPATPTPAPDAPNKLR